MLSASGANEAADMAKGAIKLMESRIPLRYRHSNMYLRQRLKPRVELTLWKIYKIDKSLLINSLGTLLTYGILLGTLGSDDEPPAVAADFATLALSLGGPGFMSYD
ncbi:hypothetical protein AVEN_103197-1 [Araneus ventricosus]|uniref:Uncharacterized protein n=1 Tax=Araneus ventricosus TaxID=182803 RepID=A0A4Y2FYI4_ARAVE|nr:hypothetical protein AVEN_103197-1 [Araneus ventricosus]